MEGMYEVIALIFGATGFWKGVEMFWRWLMERKLKQAEERNLNLQAESKVVDNWMGWSEALEKRVKEFERHNQILERLVRNQRRRILELERKVCEMEKRNMNLQEVLDNIKIESNGSKKEGR